MECLLSFIELHQYQLYLIEKQQEQSGNIDAEHELEMDLDITFPDNIPISFIIECDEGNIDNYDGDVVVNTAKLKAYKLYEKYISVGSEFEINISGLMREKIINIMDNKEKLMENTEITLKELFDIFNEAKSEMYQLLRVSLNRFSDQDDYHQIIDLIQKPIMTELEIIPHSNAISQS